MSTMLPNLLIACKRLRMKIGLRKRLEAVEFWTKVSTGKALVT